MMDTTQTDTPFMAWWQEVNDDLTNRGLPAMLFGDARHWFAQGFSPSGAAEIHAEEITH